MATVLDPKIWGSHYWFFLHTIALSYPNHPNAVTKKKYYDLIQNFSLFMPVEAISSDFSKMLDEYPITPYLDNRESFARWTWFIHNKINEKLEKPKITLDEFYRTYYDHYKPKEVKFIEYHKLKGKIVYFLVVVVVLGAAVYLHHHS
jgi:hypothetical protein